MNERERLAKHICEFLRLNRRIPAGAYFRLRTRLQKTSVAVLRSILEDDAALELIGGGR